MKLNMYFIIVFFARLSLSTAYLSAVADRLGFWGDFGTKDVSWGNFSQFLQDVAYLNPWAHKSIISLLGFSVTILEVILGVFLITGYKLRATALSSALLLGIFALSMTLTGGIKSPMNYSVFTASACSLLIFLCERINKSLSLN